MPLDYTPPPHLISLSNSFATSNITLLVLWSRNYSGLWQLASGGRGLEFEMVVIGLELGRGLEFQMVGIPDYCDRAWCPRFVPTSTNSLPTIKHSPPLQA